MFKTDRNHTCQHGFFCYLVWLLELAELVNCQLICVRDSLKSGSREQSALFLR